MTAHDGVQRHAGVKATSDGERGGGEGTSPSQTSRSQSLSGREDGVGSGLCPSGACLDDMKRRGDAAVGHQACEDGIKPAAQYADTAITSLTVIILC